MKLAVSFLSIKDDLKDKIKQLDKDSINYLHVDIMDNIFVPNKTWSISEASHILEGTNKPKDVHLMVKDIINYVDDFVKIKPEIITFHFEATNDVEKTICYIRQKNIKVGLAIKPNTEIEQISKYLGMIDLVLVMSVEPGFGGQTFLSNAYDKVDQLYNIRKTNNYNYLIEVDGGINDTNIKYLDKADIVVVGNYITRSNDYNESIKKLMEISN